ncbi:hypothetical protein B7992_08245 [Fibrobacter sp. UWH1]|nr:hypothetical protein B7992_08245 [Fibrobacter sp. UWH1]
MNLPQVSLEISKQLKKYKNPAKLVIAGFFKLLKYQTDIHNFQQDIQFFHFFPISDRANKFSVHFLSSK